jgi:hypothetical protein
MGAGGRVESVDAVIAEALAEEEDAPGSSC